VFVTQLSRNAGISVCVSYDKLLFHKRYTKPHAMTMWPIQVVCGFESHREARTSVSCECRVLSEVSASGRSPIQRNPPNVVCRVRSRSLNDEAVLARVRLLRQVRTRRTNNVQHNSRVMNQPLSWSVIELSPLSVLPYEDKFQSRVTAKAKRKVSCIFITIMLRA
jgi:hypothetical protein